MLGTPPMPHQRYVMDVATEVDPETGWFAYDEVVITWPRRAGKSAMTSAVKIHRAAAFPGANIWMSAQSGTKALDRWLDMKKQLEASELKHRIRSFTSVSHERILWKSNGSTIRPFAPDGDILHGEEIDVVDLDELWKYTAEQALTMMAGYRPTFLTTNAQAWLYSTAGNPSSAWLNQLRRDGRDAVERGSTSGTAYFEWSMPEEINGASWEEASDAEIIEAALAAHPAIGQHPRVPAERMRAIITADFPVLGRMEFVRAYGNLTTNSDVDRMFPESVVTAAATSAKIPADAAPGVAFDVDPERRAATITAAWRGPDGRAIVETIEHGLGTRWVAARVVGVLERQGLKRVTANNAGPARDVADAVERAGFEIQRVSAPDYAAACVSFHDELKDTWPTVAHAGTAELVEAFGYVTRRTLGKSWAFDTDSEPVTAVTSATLAVWAADHPPEAEIDLGPFEIR